MCLEKRKLIISNTATDSELLKYATEANDEVLNQIKAHQKHKVS